jgi:hypothetical protein
MIWPCVNLLPDTEDRDNHKIELFQLAYYTVLLSGASSSQRMGLLMTWKSMQVTGDKCVDASILWQLHHAFPSMED